MRVAARAAHMMGSTPQQSLTAEQAMAWEGLLEVSRHVRRGAEEALTEGFEMTVSMLGITGRLALAPARTLRQTALADAMGLSISRVSRLIDVLEERALVERQACPADARATNVRLTAAGGRLTARAQRTLFEHVQGSFFDQLQPAEVSVMAAAFARLINPAGEAAGAGC
jgi:DNA-binding MarR family transcriptional regulator